MLLQDINASEHLIEVVRNVMAQMGMKSNKKCDYGKLRFKGSSRLFSIFQF